MTKLAVLSVMRGQTFVGCATFAPTAMNRPTRIGGRIAARSVMTLENHGTRWLTFGPATRNIGASIAANIWMCVVGVATLRRSSAWIPVAITATPLLIAMVQRTTIAWNATERMA